jgi:hypothetical protein
VSGFVGAAVYEPSGIHDGEEVIREAGRHALFLSLQYQKVEGQEVAEEEEETRHDDEDKRRFPERMEKLHHLEWFFGMREAGFGSSYGNHHLIDHPKPILGMSRVSIIGRMTPPSDEPDAMMPMAVARFLMNHVETAFIVA